MKPSLFYLDTQSPQPVLPKVRLITFVLEKLDVYYSKMFILCSSLSLIGHMFVLNLLF